MISGIFQDQSIPKLPESSTKNHCASKNIFQDSSSKVFHDISVVKQLNKAKFPVYLIRSKVNNQTYAMKAFPHENGQPHPYYQNEIRFSQLRHPNVIKNLYYEHERRTKSERSSGSKISYKVMEYAPYGDFFEFVMKNGNKIDEKLVRTYFRQLIDGLEYLHQNGVSHMDIKLENLLIGEDYSLQIADFDLSHCAGDAKVISKGTKFYRAPEVISGKCKDTKAADIYSAAIVLFALRTQGILPHAENNCVNGINFSQLFHDADQAFWDHHCRIQGKEDEFFDYDFKELIHMMTKADVEQRATIETIKKSKWYNGPCYSPEDLKSKMKRVFWY